MSQTNNSVFDLSPSVEIGRIRMLPRRHTRQEMKIVLPDWGWLRAPRRETRVPDHLVSKVLGALHTDDDGNCDGYLEPWLPEVDPSKMLAAEGGLRWITHLRHERNTRLIVDKRRLVLAEKGCLLCEGCNVDFGKVYGPQCENFCEVHHNKPLASAQGTRVTLMDDLAILCPNCHRAIHRIDPMPTVEGLRVLISGVIGKPNTPEFSRLESKEAWSLHRGRCRCSSLQRVRRKILSRKNVG